MKLPKDYFENLSTNRYRQYLKLLPDMKQENTKMITMLIFTFLALSFFGVFAINPTLSTIVQLKKQLADASATQIQLATKIANLSSLQQQYTLLNADLPVIEDAIPQTPQAPILMGQIEAIAQQSGVTVTTFRIGEVELTPKKSTDDKAFSSFIFSLEATGSYDAMLNFAANVTQFNRIVTVESLSIGRDSRNGDLVLSMRGRQYFKQ